MLDERLEIQLVSVNYSLPPLTE